MKVVIKDGKIVATHQDSQAVAHLYPGADIVIITGAKKREIMSLARVTDPELNTLIGLPDPRVADPTLTEDDGVSDVEALIEALRDKGVLTDVEIKAGRDKVKAAKAGGRG